MNRARSYILQKTRGVSFDEKLRDQVLLGSVREGQSSCRERDDATPSVEASVTLPPNAIIVGAAYDVVGAVLAMRLIRMDHESAEPAPGEARQRICEWSSRRCSQAVKAASFLSTPPHHVLTVHRVPQRPLRCRPEVSTGDENLVAAGRIYYHRIVARLAAVQSILCITGGLCEVVVESSALGWSATMICQPKPPPVASVSHTTSVCDQRSPAQRLKTPGFDAEAGSVLIVPVHHAPGARVAVECTNSGVISKVVVRTARGARHARRSPCSPSPQRQTRRARAAAACSAACRWKDRALAGTTAMRLANLAGAGNTRHLTLTWSVTNAHRPRVVRAAFVYWRRCRTSEVHDRRRAEVFASI